MTFVALGNRTKVTLRLVFDTTEAHAAAAKYAFEGGKQTLERLDRHLATMPVG